MTRASFILVLLAACAPVGPVVSSVTDGASWVVSVDAATWPVGETTVRLAVATADGEPGAGLDVLLISGMDEMVHAPDTVWCVEENAGVYACPVRFTMPGLWNVEGTVQGGEDAEAFHLVVAVE